MFIVFIYFTIYAFDSQKHGTPFNFNTALRRGRLHEKLRLKKILSEIV